MNYYIVSFFNRHELRDCFTHELVAVYASKEEAEEGYQIHELGLYSQYADAPIPIHSKRVEFIYSLRVGKVLKQNIKLVAYNKEHALSIISSIYPTGRLYSLRSVEEYNKIKNEVIEVDFVNRKVTNRGPSI